MTWDSIDAHTSDNDKTTGSHDHLVTAPPFEPQYSSDKNTLQSASPTDMYHAETKSSQTSLKPNTRDKVEVYWPLDNEYYPGIITEEQDKNQTVVNDDGGIETLNFCNETW